MSRFNIFDQLNKKCHAPSCLTFQDVTIRRLKLRFWSMVSCSSFDLQSKCLQCVEIRIKTGGWALRFWCFSNTFGKDCIYSGMRRFGHPWSKFLLMWTVKQVKNEMISKRDKVTEDTFLLYLKLNNFFLIFIFYIFRITEKGLQQKFWHPA